jgi:hypothetical protein
MSLLAALCASIAVGACGDGSAKPDAGAQPDMSMAIDAAVDGNNNNPMTLMDTGLCLDAACTQIAPGIKPYVPRFQLWSDGATKKRWIYLPPGTKIDTSDMDFWQFPVGTKLWKEFTRDGVRVETRLVMRIGPGETSADWFYAPFVWNQAQDMAVAELFGVPDANGTQHDVPSRANCKECHDNTKPSRVLGFSAIQLDWGTNTTASDITLKSLVDENLVTNPPASPDASGVYFPLPGNTQYEQPALGYMHANCGHCHNPNSNYGAATPMRLRLTVATLGSLASTPTYMTTVNADGMVVDALSKIVVPGQPDQSILTHRFESTNPANHMPKIGTEIIDETGRTILRDWVTHIQ